MRNKLSALLIVLFSLTSFSFVCGNNIKLKQFMLNSIDHLSKIQGNEIYNPKNPLNKSQKKQKTPPNWTYPETAPSTSTEFKSSSETGNFGSPVFNHPSWRNSSH